MLLVVDIRPLRWATGLCKNDFRFWPIRIPSFPEFCLFFKNKGNLQKLKLINNNTLKFILYSNITDILYDIPNRLGTI